jgi:hypothetical protein
MLVRLGRRCCEKEGGLEDFEDMGRGVTGERGWYEVCEVRDDLLEYAVPFVVPLVYGLGDAESCGDCKRSDLLRFREGEVGEVGGVSPGIMSDAGAGERRSMRIVSGVSSL